MRGKLLNIGVVCAGALALVVPLAVLAHSALNRSIPSSIECQYIGAALDLSDRSADAHMLNMDVLLNCRRSLGNSSLLLSLAAGPLLRSFPRGLATCALTNIGVLVLLLLLAGAVAVQAARRAGVPAGLAAWATVLLLLWAPWTVVAALAFTADMIVGVTLLLALALYLGARTRDAYAWWSAAALAACLTLHAKAEWGWLCVPLLALVYVVDHCTTRGARTALHTLATAAGCTVLSVLLFQFVVPGGGPNNRLTLGLNVGGAFALLMFLVYLERGTRATYRTLAYLMPMVIVLFVWLNYEQNLRALAEVTGQLFQQQSGHSGMKYLYAVLRGHAAGNMVAAGVRLVLLAGGAACLLRREPGLPVLWLMGAVLVLAPVVPHACAFSTVLVSSAVVGGVGLAWLIEHGGRGASSQRGLALCGIAAVLLVAVSLPGFVNKTALAFEYGTGTPYRLRSRDAALPRALEALDEVIPRQASLTYTPPTVAFSHLTLEAHARLHGREWQIEPWPPLRNGTLPAVADYYIVAGPSSGASTLFPDPILAEHYRQQSMALDADERYTRILEIPLTNAAGRMAVYVRADVR